MFFDFEWPRYNLNIEEFKKLLEISETIPTKVKTKVITTIASRSTSFDIKNKRGKKTINQFLDIVLSYTDMSGLNIVAGNPAYLSETEKNKNASKTLMMLGEYIASKINSEVEIFIGTEKVLKTAAKLTAKFNFKPFLLFSNKLEAETRFLSKFSKNIKTACYTPFSTHLREEDLIKRTWKYILRRDTARDMLASMNINPKEIEKYFQNENFEKLSYEVKKAFTKVMRNFVLYGHGNGLEQELRKIINAGATIIVGLPLGETTKEISTLISSKEKLKQTV